MDSASLKLDRATEHIDELADFLQEERPFTYVLEANTRTGQRATYAKKNEAVVDRAALVCGDVLHNLRSALDHAYWEVVGPLAETKRERKLVQFPFSETQARLTKSVEEGASARASVAFRNAVLGLEPHGEPGGNAALYSIHKLNIIDKHKLLVPTGDYTRLTGEMLRAQVPDFPAWLSGTFSFGSNHRDVVWEARRMNRAERRARKVPEVIEKELDVPVQIVLTVQTTRYPIPMIDALNHLVVVARTAIDTVRAA